uniref:WW domain-containing protein n=1 Tax=Trypanosoma congolense (strain IL3000) TaxID=1068625 RepID=G0UMW5_TRYCI|nr:conserved hypothetical protein [Trypanosoma congolense IL3000]
MGDIPKEGEIFRGEDGVISVVLPDSCDPNREPTEEELHDYAEFIGIDIRYEKHLLWIAREGLQTPLPPEWKACRTGDEEPYYFNFRTGESSWDHPLDDVFRGKVVAERKKSGGSALNDDNKHCEPKSMMGSTSLTFSSSVSTGSSDGSEESSYAVSDCKDQRHLEYSGRGSSDDFQPGRRNDVRDKEPHSSFASQTAAAMPTHQSSFTETARVDTNATGLGALRPPGCAQRSKVDVNALLESGKGSVPSASLGVGYRGIGGGGKSGPFLGVKSKTTDGVPDMEAIVRRRIDEENGARRRTLRLRQERQLAEERLALDSEIQKLVADNEKQLLMEQERVKEEMLQRKEQNADTEAFQLLKKREHDEVHDQVMKLRVLLQREEVRLKSEALERIAKVKEKIIAGNSEKLKKAKDEMLVKLEKEISMDEETFDKKLEEEKKRVESDTQNAMETLRSDLLEKCTVLEEKLKLCQGEEDGLPDFAAHTFDGDIDIKKVQATSEVAIRKASADAASAVEAVRRECDNELKRLQLEKEKAVRLAEERRAKGAENQRLQMEGSALSRSLEEEDKKLQKALEIKTSAYAEETQKLLSFMMDEINSKRTSLINSTNDNFLDDSGLVSTEDQQRHEQAWRQLDDQHARALDRIRSAHEKMLREKGLFDPRKSADFAERLRVLQRKWLVDHPKPRNGLQEAQAGAGADVVGSVPANGGVLQEKIDAVASAEIEEARRRNQQELQLMENMLEEEQNLTLETYESQKTEEVEANLASYMEKCLMEHRAGETCVADSFGADHSGNEMSGCHGDKPLPEGMISLEEAIRRQNDVRSRMQGRVKLLQDATQRAQEELLQRQQVQLGPKTLSSGQRPPTVPTPATPTTFDDALHTPPFPCSQRQNVSSLATPVLNNTCSTIPSAHTVKSSDKAHMLQYLLLGTPRGVANPPVVKNSYRAMDSGQAGDDGVGNATLFSHGNGDIADRIQGLMLILLKNKDELLTKRARMEQSRAMWLEDMRECRATGDRDRALLLRQVKLSLEEKARQLNREIIELRRTLATLRDYGRKVSQVSHTKAMENVEGGSDFPHASAVNKTHVSSTPTTAAAAGPRQFIGMMDGLLSKAARLERSVIHVPSWNSTKETGKTEARRHHSPSSHRRSGGSRPAGVMHWLKEQELFS